MDETTDHLIHRLARLGLVTRPELLRAGVSYGEIRARIDTGSLRRVHPGVYATFGTPLGYPARVLAGCLAMGDAAVASHRSALSMRGLLDGEQPIDVTAPRSSHPVPAGLVLHRPDVLRPQDVTVKGAVPITNPLRSLLDAGVELRPREVGECVERALLSRLVTVRGLRVIVGELGGRGRTGTAALRSHLDRRALGDRRPESMIEPLMARLLYSDLGLGPIQYQPTIRLDGRVLRRDFLVTLARAVVEVDGLDAHGSRQALDDDLARQNLLVRHGFLVLRYTVSHLRRPARVAAEIVETCLPRIGQVPRLSVA